MTFVEDKSRMTHSGFFRSGAPSTRMLDLQLQPHPPRPTSEMQANNATARTRSRSSILQSRLACSDRISDRRLVVNGARKLRCRVVLEKELRARMAGKWQPRQPLTNSNQFAPALTSSPLHSSLFTLHSSPRAGSSCTGSAQYRGAISKAMMSSQVRGLGFLLTFCLLLVLLLIEVQRCQRW